MTTRSAAALLIIGAAVIGLGTFPLVVWSGIVLAATVAGTALIGLAVWRGAKRGPRLGDDPAGDRRWAVLVFAVAVVIRLLLMPAEHVLSDDAFRYHWDGKVLAGGTNPYRYAPNDEALAHHRTHALDARINHPDVVTVYPPYTELVFAAGYLLSPGHLLGFRALVLLSEIAAWLVLYREATRRHLPRAFVLLATWLPLVVFESYLPGHTEALALPLVALLVSWTVRGRSALAGVALGLACLVKPVALLFVPAVVRELGLLRSVRVAVAALATVGLFYLPFLGAGENLTSSMLLMARKWEFNASLAALLGAVLPGEVLRPVLLVLLVVGVLGATWWGRDLVSRMLWAVVALVVVTPTLYPWYLIWALPMVVLRPQPALIALCGLAPLAHVAAVELYATGVWDPPRWPSLVSYTVFYVLLAAGGIRAWHARGDGRHSALR